MIKTSDGDELKLALPDKAQIAPDDCLFDERHGWGSKRP
jgi:hypothetical protein